MKLKYVFLGVSISLFLSLVIMLPACKKKDEEAEKARIPVDETEQIPKKEVKKRRAKSEIKVS